jgi:hypothetical protein
VEEESAVAAGNTVEVAVEVAIVRGVERLGEVLAVAEAGIRKVELEASACVDILGLS